jgi:hypothetical protein
VQLRKLLIVAGLVLGAALGAGPAYAQGACDWEWGGVVETVPAQCNVADPVYQDEPVDVTVTNEDPVPVSVQGTVPVEEQSEDTGSGAVVQAVEDMEKRMVLGLGLLVFLFAVHLVGTWGMMRRRGSW